MYLYYVNVMLLTGDDGPSADSFGILSLFMNKGNLVKKFKRLIKNSQIKLNTLLYAHFQRYGHLPHSSVFGRSSSSL